jgi:lipopolysaccharide export system protein LptA
MAPIVRDCVAAGAAALLAAATLGAAPAPSHVTGAAGLHLPGGKITYDTSGLELDYKTQQAVLHNVTMAQGDVKVSADRADVSGLNREDSRWTFTGNVRISSGQHGNLKSDRATVEIRNSRVRTALATGHPAEFEQTASKTGMLAHGHADSIEYTFDTGTIRLDGDAWLRYGDDVISGCELVYNIAAQKLQAASGACGADHDRVHITIPPRKGAKPGSTP